MSSHFSDILTEKRQSEEDTLSLEMQPSQYKYQTNSNPTRRRRLFLRHASILILCGISFWFLYPSLPSLEYKICTSPLQPQIYHNPKPNVAEDKENVTKIPLEAHIMSKCPDAKDCLQKLVVPSMVEISDKVNFTLSYIGSIDSKSDAVSCMHGPGECLGNIIQLCAAKIYPDPKLYLGFANCMTSQYEKIPDRDLIENCAMEHGLDFKKVNDCISDEGEGVELLRASVERSQQNHVKTSCTIRLNDEVRCVRDGGEWYDCPGGSEVSNLVDDIEKLYKKANKKES